MYRVAVGIVWSLTFWLVSVGAQDGLSSSERLWTDSTGRFQVKAKLIRKDPTQVVLKKSDGRTIEIPIARLSKANQTYLKQLKTPAEGDAKPLSTESLIDGPQKPVDSKLSLGSARRLDYSQPIWNVKVASAQSPSNGSRTISLPKPHGRRQPHAINGLFRKAAVSDVSGSGASAQTRLLVGDFRSGELTELPPETGAAMHPVALLGDGTTIVMVGTGKDGTTSTADLQSWRVKNGVLQRGEIWTPYADRRNSTIRFATAGPGNSLITCSKGGHVVAWEMPSRRAMWQIEMGSPPYWHTTEDQSRLAIASATQLVIVDLSDGKIVGSQPLSVLGRISYPKLSFNPSEDKLYLSSIGRVLILDLQSNRWIQDIDVSGVGTSNGAIFCDDKYVLIDGSSLVDWRSGAKVARYSGLGAPLQAGHFTYVVSDTEMRMIDLPLAESAGKPADSSAGQPAKSEGRPQTIAMDRAQVGSALGGSGEGNSADINKQAAGLIGRWQIQAEDSYGSGNIGKSRSTYRFATDKTYEVYSTLTVLIAATGKQVYTVTSREQGTWTQQGKEICLTEKESKLVEFKSATSAVTRETFETAIAKKAPPVTYTILSQDAKTVKLGLAGGGGTMVLQRVD
ncbi:SHD1 domain-containing protein [Planctomycetes bacterium K23_9]|uniref:SLA1 homology domain-containing protein n=1 Tax=Stieleria marina TaxID=1930275 RepID=A0A517NQF0_9BACT|nr:hypothetical protein K239x_12900 [Planctomycetes bacterium K23_9]